MGRRQKNKERFDTRELCSLAAERLKTVGFERIAVSMKSEAVYFRLPGRHGLLRVSAHGGNNPPIGLDFNEYVNRSYITAGKKS